MIITEKTKQLLVQLGAPPECPRDYFRIPHDLTDLGFSSTPDEDKVDLKSLLEDTSLVGLELVICSGFSEEGWKTQPELYLHEACQSCSIRGKALQNRNFFNQ